MRTVECPYCGEDVRIELEDEREDETYRHECSHCEKTFTYTITISIDISAEKAPCLNDDAPHQWEPIKGYPEEYFKGKERCKVCDEERTV